MIDSNFFKASIASATIEKLVKISGAKILKDEDREKKIKNVAPLHVAGTHDISFFHNEKYLDQLKETKAGACIVSEKCKDFAPEGVAILVSDNPYLAYAKISSFFYPAVNSNGEIHERAIIETSAKIDDNVQIGPNAIIGKNAKIGKNSVIEAGAIIGDNVQIGASSYVGSSATVKYAIIGKRVIIHPGVRIGQDGFGFASGPEGHIKIPQLGRVIIEDQVEIGANSTIDRGALKDTIVGMGTKIDNLVQIGHNAKIGKFCFIVSQAGVAGSSELGDFVILGGQVGVAGHLKIASFSKFGGQAGVTRNILKGGDYRGYPAIPAKKWELEQIAVRRLVKASFNNKKDK